MKKFYSAIAFGSLLLSSVTGTKAQCTGGRYHDYIFPTFPDTTNNVIYGSNLKTNSAGVGTTQILKMDIYQPTGDASTNRALVIVAHGGSFIGGSKTGTDVTPLCRDLAKMGYVTASIDYRTGMTNFPFASSHTLDSTDAGAAVMRAVHDGRAAIRFFRKNARIGGNTYGIDTNNIYFAGVSAGGFISLHVAYMNSLSEFPNYVDTTGQPGLHGGIEGQSGNPGYSSSVKAIVNICGAIGDTAWMQPGDIPVLSFHGTADGTVPYGSALIYLSPPSTYPLLEVDGSCSVAKRANNVGITNCMETWFGKDHIPEVGTTTSELAYYDSTITITRNFLEHFTCGVSLNCSYTMTPQVGITELHSNIDFNLYPNPAQTAITVDLSEFFGKTVQVEVFDAMGKRVKNIEKIKDQKTVISRDGLSNGIYLISITSEGMRSSKMVMFE
jgi:para-nitrobenzyl esterase